MYLKLSPCVFALSLLVSCVRALDFSSSTTCPDAIVLSSVNVNYSVDAFQLLQFPGLRHHPAWLWSNVQLNINCQSPSYEVFASAYNDTVCAEYEKRSSLLQKLFVYDAWNPDVLFLPPFQNSFIGINPKDSQNSCQVYHSITKLFAWYPVLLALSVVIFFNSKYLSGSVALHYSTGTLIGIFGSVLVLSFYFSRLLPKKWLSATVILGGWSVTAYLFKLTYQNMMELLADYHAFVIGYLVIVGGISLAVTYYKGPITDDRARRIISVFIKFLCLLGVWNSFQLEEVSVSCVILLLSSPLVASLFARSSSYFRRKWITRFPPKRKLLTVEEYREEAARETERALMELRSFCQQPNSRPWRIVQRLSRPDRMASFVEGDSHVSAAEMSWYDEEMSRIITDSEDEHDVMPPQSQPITNGEVSSLSDDESDPEPLDFPNRPIRS